MKREHDTDLKQKASKKQVLVRLCKCFVGLAVVFGLWRTVESARQQLADQRTVIRSDVRDLDSKIASATSSSEREALRLERQELLRQMPNILDVDGRLVALAALFYLMSLLPPALFFHQTLRQFGQSPKLMDSISAHILGHVGKYVPGKAMVVVLRVSAITGKHVRGPVATVAVFVETLVMMAVGGTISGILVVSLDMPQWIRLLAIGLGGCAAVPTLPPLFQRVVDRISQLKIGADSGLENVSISWSLMARGWGWMLLMWGGIAVAFYLLLSASPGAPADLSVRDFLLSMAAISLAMVAGFVSLLPGGAGVRELVLSTVLAARFGVVPALSAAVLARLVFLAVEFAVGGALWFIKQKRKREVEKTKG